MKQLMDELMNEIADEVVDDEIIEMLKKTLQKNTAAAGLKYDASAIRLFLSCFEFCFTAFAQMGPQGAATLLMGMRKLAKELDGNVDLSSVEEVYALVPSRPLEKSERDAVILESNRNDGEWDLKILSDSFEIDILKNVGFTDKELGIVDVSFKAKVGGNSHEVVVECDTEKEQERVWNELKEKGYKVRVLTY